MAFFRLRLVAPLLSVIIVLLAAPCAAQNLGSRRTRYLSGFVKDALGRPLAGSNVTLKSIDGRVLRTATTDSRGVFRFKEPGAGWYSITAQGPGFRPATVPVLMPQRTQGCVQVTLESQRALNLSVTASRIRAQNVLSSSGTSKYTLTEHDIANLPEGQATALNQVMLQMPGVALGQN